MRPAHREKEAPITEPNSAFLHAADFTSPPHRPPTHWVQTSGPAQPKIQRADANGPNQSPGTYPRFDAGRRPRCYAMCPETSLVISNIDTVFLPLKTAFNASSALIMVRFLASWSLFFLM